MILKRFIGLYYLSLTYHGRVHDPSTVPCTCNQVITLNLTQRTTLLRIVRLWFKNESRTNSYKILLFFNKLSRKKHYHPNRNKRIHKKLLKEDTKTMV